MNTFNDDFWNTLNGIRLSVNCPLIAELNGEGIYIGHDGLGVSILNSYIVTSEDLKIMMELITKSSAYSYSRFINECFITLPGGNRVGLVGECVIENNKITSVKNVNSIYIRVSSERKNCTKIFVDEIYDETNIYNTLIISPPGCGKTTALRDICYQASTIKRFKKIIIGAIIDERFEIACNYNGIPTVDIGKNNFVISGCPKNIAIPLVIRSMSPDVIFVDELDAAKDFDSVSYAISSGCKIIATTHGDGIEKNRAVLNDKNIFEKYIVLSRKKGPGTLERICRKE